VDVGAAVGEGAAAFGCVVNSERPKMIAPAITSPATTRAAAVRQVARHDWRWAAGSRGVSTSSSRDHASPAESGAPELAASGTAEVGAAAVSLPSSPTVLSAAGPGSDMTAMVAAANDDLGALIGRV
jgi:hypothetical protein